MHLTISSALASGSFASSSVRMATSGKGGSLSIDVIICSSWSIIDMGLFPPYKKINLDEGTIAFWIDSNKVNFNDNKFTPLMNQDTEKGSIFILKEPSFCLCMPLVR